MKESEKEDFKTWFRAQPDYCSYTRVRKFLSGLLDCNNSEAEVEMARLQKEEEIRIIAKKAGSSGRRVFLEPLPPLTEADIRSVWSSEMANKKINKIAVTVHDRTGHDVTRIKKFMRNLDNATVTGDKFKWHESDPLDDDEEVLRG